MVITVLLENTACRGDLGCEHGLSLHLESRGRRILFDAGSTGLFAENAAALGIDLGAVDWAVLSHGHYDHGGGLPVFLDQNRHAPVYLRRQALGQQHNASGKYIGLPRGLDQSRLIFTGEEQTPEPGFTLYGPGPAQWPLDSAGLTRMEDGVPVPDQFCHEQYLLVQEGDKRILFSGCSHRGILNIAARFRPDILVGGFHFMKLDPYGPDRRRLEEAAQVLLEQPTVYYTGHCTGQPAYDFLKERMADRLQSISTGSIIRI